MQATLRLEIVERREEVGDIELGRAHAGAVEIDEGEPALVNQHVVQTEGAVEERGAAGSRTLEPEAAREGVEVGREPRKGGADGARRAAQVALERADIDPLAARRRAGVEARQRLPELAQHRAAPDQGERGLETLARQGLDQDQSLLRIDRQGAGRAGLSMRALSPGSWAGRVEASGLLPRARLPQPVERLERAVRILRVAA